MSRRATYTVERGFAVTMRILAELQRKGTFTLQAAADERMVIDGVASHDQKTVEFVGELFGALEVGP